MNCSPRQKIYLALSTAVLVLHLIVAAVARPSFGLTMFGDAIPCLFLLLAILAIQENTQTSPGILPVFWKVIAGGFSVMLFSQAFWFYFDARRLNFSPSPVLGDSLYLVAHVFFLSALALRPYSSSSSRDLRIRSLDFVLLSLWWLCLYGYFALPWNVLLDDAKRYNLDYCLTVSLEQLSIVAALGVLSAKRRGAWRVFYFELMLAFLLLAVGNLLMSDLFKGYYAGGYYDTPFLVAIYLFTVIACSGARLQPQEDTSANLDLVLNVWTARAAMLVMLSLPLIALLGLSASELPHNIIVFRLRLIFGAMFVLGALVYWKLNLVSRELVRLVHLTRDSIDNLKTVQQRVTHSEKFVALGRLAAGAAHEISNPLTAILGYSELLADIPGLSAEDRAQAQKIREQVHRAQSAVASLRNTMRQRATPLSLLIDKKPDS